MTEPDPSILRYYLGIVWRWKWLVVVPLVILPAVTYVLASNQAQLWGSSAAVLLNHQDQIASTIAGVETPPEDAGRYAVTQGLVARSPELLRRVTRAAGVPQMSTRTLVQHSDVSPNADVLQFYVTNGDPELATRLVNSYAREYTSYRRELDTRDLDTTVRALGARLDQLERAGQASSPTYTRLAAQQEQVRLIESLRRSSVYVIRTSAAGDAEQVAPRPLKNTAVSIGAALVLGLVLVGIANAFDRRVFDPREVSAALGAPLLARAGSRRRHLADGEALRLAALVRQAAGAASARSILVAGVGAGTRLAAALGEGMARVAGAVVLVDADLHGRALTRAFGLEGQSGLTDLLRGNGGAAAPVDFSAGGGSGALRVLGAGTAVADPAAVLASTGTSSTLRSLPEADIVLVAGPPFGSAAESFTLADSVDAILLLIRAGVDRRALAEARRALDLTSTTVLGYVLLDARDREASRGLGRLGRERRRGRSAEPDARVLAMRSEALW